VALAVYVDTADTRTAASPLNMRLGNRYSTSAVTHRENSNQPYRNQPNTY